jgi:hypothetical protein
MFVIFYFKLSVSTACKTYFKITQQFLWPGLAVGVGIESLWAAAGTRQIFLAD